MKQGLAWSHAQENRQHLDSCMEGAADGPGVGTEEVHVGGQEGKSLTQAEVNKVQEVG